MVYTAKRVPILFTGYSRDPVIPSEVEFRGYQLKCRRKTALASTLAKCA
jgi:hypothetical protein